MTSLTKGGAVYNWRRFQSKCGEHSFKKQTRMFSVACKNGLCLC